MRERCAALAAMWWLSALIPAMADDYDRHGHAIVQDGQGLLYVDQDGRAVLRPYIFDNGPDYFVEGLARFVERGKIGFHDEALNVVIPAQYDFAYPFAGGVTRVGTNCQKEQHGEHSSVYCEKWETVSRPAD